MSRWRLAGLVSVVFVLVAISAVGVYWRHFINSDDVRAMVRQGQDLWVGTYKGGLLHLSDLTSQGATVEKWTRDNGLPTNNVFAVSYDDIDGAKWLGTDVGVVRFDDSSTPPTITIYDTSNTPELPSDTIQALATVSGLGFYWDIWVGTDLGLVRYMYDPLAGDTWQGFDSSDGLPSDDVSIRSILVDDFGTSWFATDEGVAFDRGQMYVPRFWYWDSSMMPPHGSGLPSDTVNALARSSFGNLGDILWCGTDDAGLVGLWARDTATGSAGTLAFWGMDMRPLQFDSTSGLPSDRVLSLEYDASYNLWIGTDKGAVYWMWTEQSSTISTETVIEERQVRDMLAVGTQMGYPGDYMLYFGTDWRVWFRFWDEDASDFAAGSYELDQIASNHVPGVNSFDQDYFASCWFATDRGVSWYDGGWTTYDTTDGMVSATTTVVRPSADGVTVWVGTVDGLVMIDTSSGSIVNYTTASGLPSNVINDIALQGSPPEIVWVATDNGASSFNGVMFTNYLIGSHLTSLTIDDDGELWFGTQDMGLYRGTSGLVRYDTGNSGIISDSIRDVKSMSEGIIYVATDQGVSRYDKVAGAWTNYDVAGSGLLSDNVRCVAFDAMGLRTSAIDPFTDYALFGTDSGVSRLFRFADDAGTSFEQWTAFVAASVATESILDNDVLSAHVFPGRLNETPPLPFDFTVSWFGHESGASLRVQSLPELSNETVSPDWFAVEGTAFDLGIDYDDDEAGVPVVTNLYLSDDDQLGGPYQNLYVMTTGVPGPGTYTARTASLPRGRYYFYFYFIDDDFTIARSPQQAGRVWNGLYLYDTYENDNNCGEARPIAISEAWNLIPDDDHSLIYNAYGRDQDWYLMEGLTGGWYYLIWTDDLSPDADTDIYVYSGTCPDGLQLEASVTGDEPINPSPANLWWLCPADGDYWLMVTDGDSWSGNPEDPVPIAHNYDVTVVEYQVDQYEDDDICDEAVAIEPDCVSQFHTLVPYDDQDWLTFEGLAGIKYRVFTSSLAPDTATDIYVYSGECGDLTLVGSDTGAGYGVGSNVEFLCTETGTFYVMIEHHDAGTLGSGYRVAVCSELWPMLGCDKGHRGYLEADGPTTNKVEWARAFGTVGLNQIVGIDQTARLMVSATDGTIYAVLPNGRLDWSYATGVPMVIGPVVDHAGNVVAAMQGGTIISIAPDGTVNWGPRDVGVEVTAPLTIGDDGNIYVGCQEATLFALDATTGFAIVGYPIQPPVASGAVVGSPAIDSDGRVYFVTEGNVDVQNVFCVVPGPPPGFLWQRNVPPVLTTAAPTLSNDESELYVGGMNGVIYALDTSDGSILWNFATGGPIWGSPAVHGTSGTLFIPSEDGILYCVDPTTHNLIWSYEAGGPIRSSPAVDAPGHVYFGSDDGYFYCLNPDGTLLWSYDFGVPVDSSPSLDTYGFVYITVGHELFVFDEWVPDPRAPSSSCSCPEKVTSAPIPVSWTARDNKSGVKSVKLWYRYSAGGAWTDWRYSGLEGLSETGTFDFPALEGQGVYQFYTIAEDYAGNVEEAPAAADCECLYNAVFPESYCTSPEYDNAMPIPVEFVSEGVNGIFHTVLWFRYNGGPWTCSGQARQGTSGTISFNVNLGDGIYDFYTVALDNVGNEEPRPGEGTAADSTTVYDTQRPVSSCWTADAGFTTQHDIPVVFRSHDTLSGVKRTVLYYRKNGGDWQDSGLSLTGRGGTFVFDASATGEASYEFATIAEDNAGNLELGPSAAKAGMVYDETAPDSSCSLAGKTDTEIILSYTATDNVSGVVSVQLWYRMTGGEWKLWPTMGSGGSGTFTFVPKLGDGTYEFYTIAEDAAGNVEGPPTLPEYLTVYFDVLPPSSFCTAPSLTTSDEVNIGFEAHELNNGVKLVSLYYRYEGGQWRFSGLSRRGRKHGIFKMRLRDGDGRYEFYTIAEDYVGNVEEAPASPDAETLFDTVAPSSFCTSAEFTNASQIEVGYSAQDAVSGVDRVRLFYSLDGGDFVDSGLCESSSSGTFLFDVPADDGEYAFYTIAVDRAGHRERVPDMPDAVTVVDRQAPWSQCSCPSLANATSVTITYQAGDDRPEPVTVHLWFTFNSGVAQDTGLSLAADTGSFEFELGLGEGLYGFYTIAEDTSGNQEPPRDPDCFVLLDMTAPVSTCTSGLYAVKSPLSVHFSAQDPDQSVTQEGSGVKSVRLCYRYKRYADLPAGEWQEPGIRMDLAQGTFSFWAKEGEGFYDFVTRAEDKAGNVEAMRTEPDTSIIYDVTPPSSVCSSPAMVAEPRIPVQFKVSEITSGVEQTTLWYRFEDGQFTSTRITRPGLSGEIIFRPREGFGRYDFYTISVDKAGNVERPPLVPDTSTRYARSEPDIRLDRDSIDYGKVMVNQSVRVDIHVFNDGTVPLTISGTQITTMALGAPFVDENFNSGMYPMTINPGSFEIITIRFAPPAVGQFTGTLTISSDDPDEAEVTVSLTGEGILSGVQMPDIDLSGVDSIDFGNVPVHTTARYSLAVYNLGADDLIIYRVFFSALTDWEREAFADANPSDWYPHIIGPNDSAVIPITFTPTHVDRYRTAAIAIESNDPDEGTVRVSLAGEGISTGAGVPDIDLCVTDVVDFGDVSVGAEGEGTFVVCNVGDGNLTITGTYFGGDQGIFSDGQPEGWYPHLVAPGDRVSIRVIFRPAEAVEYSGYCDVYSDDPDEPGVRVTLRGNGVAVWKGLTVFLEAEPPTVKSGESFSLNFGVLNPGGPRNVMFVAAAILPDGSLLFYPGWRSEPVPIVAALPGDYSFGPAELFNVVFGPWMPAGRYTFFAVAFDASTGSIASNLASASWVFED